MRVEKFLQKKATGFCWKCGQRKTKFVRLSDRLTLTKTELQLCQRKSCSEYFPMDSTPGWVLKGGPKNYRRDFGRQNSPDYHPEKRNKSSAL